MRCGATILQIFLKRAHFLKRYLHVRLLALVSYLNHIGLVLNCLKELVMEIRQFFLQSLFFVLSKATIKDYYSHDNEDTGCHRSYILLTMHPQSICELHCFRAVFIEIWHVDMCGLQAGTLSRGHKSCSNVWAVLAVISSGFYCSLKVYISTTAIENELSLFKKKHVLLCRQYWVYLFYLRPRIFQGLIELTTFLL